MPAAAAEIHGRVIHPTRPEAAADVEVRLLGLAKDEQTLQRQTRTDSKGNYRFDDLPAPAAYLLSASFDGISFPGGTVSFRSEDEPAKPPLTFHVYDRSTDASALSTPSLRWVVDREAGLYEVVQTLAVSNSSFTFISVEADEAPLLRLPLAPGHGEVRTSFGRLPEGVTVYDGVAELRGPFFPGESEIRLSYDLVADGALRTEVGGLEASALDGPWPAGAPRVGRLELYLQDFGIEVDAGTLHPARPARSGDVIYLAFLGFELEPGSRYPVRISPLPPTSVPPTWATILVVSLLAGGSLFMVARPVATSEGRDARPDADSLVEVEKEALRSALADLDFDFETGKLSVEDRDRLRGELSREAVRSLAHGRRAPTVQAPAVAPPRCSCGRQALRGDRFCASCGKSL
jgi:hypothetical protein